MAVNIIRSVILVILAAIIPSSCSDTVTPSNLEPSLMLHDAYDVTRTEAVLSAEIINRGTGKLSYVRFLYSGDGSTFIATEKVENPSGRVDVRISGLKPGTRYIFFAEGGSPTASINTEKNTFTTVPNTVPAVTGAEILSSGPTAVVAGFSITEDGGEPLLEAGCEVKDMNSGTSVRHYATDEDLKTGDVRIVIKSLEPLTGYRITPFSSNAVGEAKGEPVEFTTRETVSLSSPGDLSSVVDAARLPSTYLSISGAMNGDDFRFLRRLLAAPPLPGDSETEGSLDSVDLTDVSVVEGGGTYDGERYISPGIISTGLFSGCARLREVELPFSVTSIERDAFGDCRRLRTLTIPASVRRVLPSSGCVALEKIDVSAANKDYKSVDGVLYDDGVTETVWFPLGKTGKYSLPSTITSIGENAFSGTGITSLEIPASVREISRGAFSGSALCEISLPDNLSRITEGLFQNCNSLRIVRLGKRTESLGNYIFDGCPLEHIYISAELPPYVSDGTFSNSSQLFESCTLHVPAGSKALYRNHSRFGKFHNIVENQ